MNGRELVEALHSGRRVYGTCITAPSPRWPGVVKGLGLDFVFIDTEHVAQDRERVAWMCGAYRTLGIAPVVRIPEPDPYQACMVFDGGAEGVIAPYVETAAQVRALAGAAKLRPLKGKRLYDRLDGAAALEPELERYLSERNAASALIVNIESTPALAALDEILAVPGLDAVLIGPHDLTCSLGIPEQYRHPRFDEAVRTIVRKARAAGVGAGIHYWLGTEQEIAWAKDGLNLLIHSTDSVLFAAALRADLATLKEALGDAPSRTRPEARDTV
ncbi:MAG TPA: aldolase/citrate lyase family protein [Planctomycetota bacterium]|nr:aldolase/citrate lyase family protein [Planctomycetota bacterium]